MSRRRNYHSLRGRGGPIEITRDDRGIPRIEARTAEDSLLGMGYCHGVDRPLQMLFVRILGRGRLSKYLDSSDRALAVDTFFRRLDFCRDADAEYAKLSAAERGAVDAYCRGVNLALEERGTPWELRLLGYRPVDDPWNFADIVLTAKIIGYIGLAATQGEVERWLVECVQAGMELPLLEELFPGKLGDLDVDLIRSVKVTHRVVPEEIWEIAALPKVMASNNWVVSGSKTASGKPIVCNDPHLEVNRIPPVFHESIQTWLDSNGKRRYAMGGSVPGCPGIVTGRNRDMAWGVTYAYMDAIDSWVEDCRDGKYRRGDRWVDFKTRVEVIERKGKPSVTVQFHETEEHGTLDGDPNVPGRYLATRWSNGEETSASSVAALFSMMEADNVVDGRANLAKLSNSAWCFVMGDRSGSIAYQMTGRMPIRREGATGLCPLPGWDPENDWKGFASWEDLPRDIDPECGYLATANDDLNHLGKLKPINLTVVPYRGERIREVLAASNGITTEHMKQLQYDLTSTQARRYMELLRPILAEFDSSNAKALAAWDCVYRDRSTEPTLFETFYRALVSSVFAHALGDVGSKLAEHLFDKTTILCEYYAVLDRILLKESSPWFKGRHRDELYRRAIEISGLLTMTPVTWGEKETVPIRNILLGGKLPQWLGFDRPPIRLPGARATVTQGQVSTALGYPSATGPSIRIVADLATDELHVNLPGGASDRRFSPWYASGIRDWLEGRYKVLRGEPRPASGG